MEVFLTHHPNKYAGEEDNEKFNADITAALRTFSRFLAK